MSLNDGHRFCPAIPAGWLFSSISLPMLRSHTHILCPGLRREQGCLLSPAEVGGGAADTRQHSPAAAWLSSRGAQGGPSHPRGGARVVAHFKKDIYCGGSLVFQEAETPVLAGYGTVQEGPEVLSNRVM